VDNNHSDKVKSIFLAAIERSEPERAAYLDDACAGDAGLRARVEELLQAHEQMGSFHEQPAPANAPTADFAPIAEAPGTTIGRYKLLQEIGEGGMGVVFMAEQVEPVKRRVAVKIIKQGMDTRQFVARFEAERQALAMMDHPNIARVLDAGCTETGRPYFVMELVKGIPITKFCDENRLTARQRLELVVSVCQAVQHAHQKGIIHRDLKPSNVLVALYDDRPVPKIIDFGVAKTTHQQLTEKTLFTQVGQIVGTLEYMSPEQAVLNQLDVDTRTDIYSLGVVLYELLTGVTPVESSRLRSAALDETLRIIREEEPPKPSTRVSSLGAVAAATATYRGTSAASLTKTLRGDLDWIVMKALEKPRSRRYETASALGADLKRYLEGEPVEARPPSTLYRLRKAASRHRVALGTSAVVALTLVAATMISLALAARHGLLLEKAQVILYDKILMFASVGDVYRTRLALQEAKTVEIPAEWVPLAEGVAHSWKGQHVEARKFFDEALRLNRDFYAANAAYTQVIRTHPEYLERVKRLRQSQPATPLDYLFQAQVEEWLSPEKSLEALARCGQWKNTALARFLGGIARVNLALREGNFKAAKAEIATFDELLDWYPGNAVPLCAKLYTLLGARNLAKRSGLDHEADEYEKSAKDVAKELDKYSANIFWVTRTRAWCFAECEQGALAIGEWKKRVGLEPYGIDPMHYAAHVMLFGSKTDIERAIAALPDAYGADNGYALLAKAYLLAMTNAARAQVAEACDRLLDSAPSAEMRCACVEVWLAYGDAAEAKKQAKGAAQLLAGESENEEHWSMVLEYVAENISEPQFLDLFASLDSPMFQANANYFAGLRAWASKDRERARHCFQECCAKGQCFANWYWWSKVFLSRGDGAEKSPKIR
jgi:serine/threonine protein kinase